ncbi:MAG TPA: NUDIX hydrolase [Candidatus Saccharimonadales bacterium]|nr:NUDIX hydrolase [Candidatus Saccharimonadales bacterium]
MASSKSLQMLSCFYYKNVCSFIEMCNIGDYSSDLGGYYIRQLIHDGYIGKIDRGQYQILSKGKHFLVANTEKLTMRRQARMSVALVIRQGDKFAVMHRTAQPFIGRIEWPTGSVKPGESMADAAARVALERLGTAPSLRLLGFFRRIDTYKDEVFDDKLFAVHTGALPDDYIVTDHSKAGVNRLYMADELLASPSPSRSLIDIFEYASSSRDNYIEHKYNLEATDLSISNQD